MSPLAVWGAALAIGVSLGLMGSGGSILTVPVLTYLVGQDEKVAIAGSLGIVGGISLFGAVPYALRRWIDWPSVVLFGLPGMAGTYLGAGLSQYLPGAGQLALFAGVAVAAAAMMLRRQKKPERELGQRRAPWRIALDGLAVGVLTGLVGVGGGFLIVPALVLLGGLDMRKAAGTSLLIIALKSAAGFWRYQGVLAGEGLELDWGVLGLVLAIGVVGSVAGNLLSARIPAERLSKGFAVFLLLVGLAVGWQSVGELITG